jgi:putative addiction module killer protein
MGGRLKVIFFETQAGYRPFEYWLSSLNDRLVRDRVLLRLVRLEQGNFGDHKLVSLGVWELRMNFGGGIRIYYGIVQDEILLLLLGGNNNSQKKDIPKAIN